MSVNSPERTLCESALNRTWNSLLKANGVNARSECPKPGLQGRARACGNSKNSEECSVQLAIDLIHGKWKTRILSRLQHGPARLGELRRIFPQASKKMLTQHLREMQEDGLVIRRDLSDRVLHVEYSLSDSRGLAILQLVDLLRNWSNEHLKSPTNISEDSRIEIHINRK